MQSLMNYLANINESAIELKSVKSADDLRSLCMNRYLVIHSLVDPLQYSKGLPQMYIVRFSQSDVKIDSFDRASGLSLTYIGLNNTGWSKKWTSDEIFKFFEYNKSRKHRMYVLDDIDVKDAVKTVVEKIRSISYTEIPKILSYNVTNEIARKNILSPAYVVHGSTGNHGEQYFEFDYNKKGYTFYYNVYSFEPKLIDGRRFSRADGSRDQAIYKVYGKDCSVLMSLFQEIIENYSKGLQLLKLFFNEQKVGVLK